MSTDWGYKCNDCDIESDHWLNHGENTLTEAYRIYNELKLYNYQSGLVTVTLEFDFSEYFISEIKEFLNEHSRHNMVLCSEYGRELPLDTEQEIG